MNHLPSLHTRMTALIMAVFLISVSGRAYAQSIHNSNAPTSDTHTVRSTFWMPDLPNGDPNAPAVETMSPVTAGPNDNSARVETYNNIVRRFNSVAEELASMFKALPDNQHPPDLKNSIDRCLEGVSGLLKQTDEQLHLIQEKQSEMERNVSLSDSQKADLRASFLSDEKRFRNLLRAIIAGQNKTLEALVSMTTNSNDPTPTPEVLTGLTAWVTGVVHNWDK